MIDKAKIKDKKLNAKKSNTIINRQKTDSFPSVNSPVEKILYLHRTIGNRAVERLFKSGAIQAKFKIDKPNDMSEQEADRAAEQVMCMPEPSIQSKLILAKNSPS